jgi:peptidyl-prolyl cis-trans isomerase SurA
MNHRLTLLVFAATLCAFASAARAGDVLDRVVATVNNQIILQSEWEDETHYEAFVNGRPLDQLQSTDRKAALDHLIDQELLLEQMQSSGFPHVNNEEVEKRVQEIRRQYSSVKTDADWHSLLLQYGLTGAELTRRVALQADLMGLVDARLRPDIVIDSKSIESYYNQELLPQLQQSGAPTVPLVAVTPKIKELLTQQKMNQMLIAWLQDLRSGSEIRTESLVGSGGQLR